jgi:hypothetical protein
MADANVYVRYLADASKLVTESKKANRATASVGDTARDADRNFAKFAGRAATFFAGSAALAGISSWAMEGAKLADTADLVRVSWEKTYGEAGPLLVSALDDQRRALGLAEFEMQQMLTTTGQLMQQQGLTKQESADFSAQLFTMAGDVAAFTGNLDSAPEVLGAFQAALRGEFDPLEQFGIKLSAAAIAEKALEMTGKATTAELTSQEKQAATLELIIAALGDETGALTEAQRAGRTAANENTAAMKDNQEAVGQTVQVVKDFANSALAWAIEQLGNFGGWLGRTMAAMDSFGKTTGGVIGAVVRFFSDLLEMLWRVGDGGANMAKRFRDAINSILSPIRGVVNAVGGLRRAVSSAASFAGSALGKARGILGFQTGGMVPGARGVPQLAVVHGGEQVLTPQQQRMAGGGGGGGGSTYNITVNAGLSDPYSTAQAIVDLLRMYQRTQGDLPTARTSG